MAESAEFILKLNDQVSGAAKTAADSLRRIDDKATNAARRMGLVQLAAEKMNRQLGQSAANTAAKALDAQAKAADKAAAATRKLGLMQLQAQKMDKDRDARKSSGFLSSFTGKLGHRSISDYASGAFFGELAASAATGIMGAFVSGASSAVSLIASGIKGAFVEGGKLENLRLSYKHLLGTQGGKEALASISGFASHTRYDDDKVAEMMRPLFNAGLKGTGARTAFALSEDASVRQGKPVEDFIEQFAKIQLKGGVTEKMLIGLGVSVKDFKSALVTETGMKDKEAAFKKATEGKLNPMAIQNSIVRATEKHFGTKTGTATKEASVTMSARLQKIGELPDNYLKKMADSPAWQMLSDKLGGVLASLDPDSPRGQKIVGALFKTFNSVADAINAALTPENLDAFVGTLRSIIDDVTILVKTIHQTAAFVGYVKDIVAPGLSMGSGPGSLAEAMNTSQPSGGAAANILPRSPSLAGAKNSSAGGSVTNINGDVHIAAPVGSDPKETAAAFFKHIDETHQKGLEKAAAHGGA